MIRDYFYKLQAKYLSLYIRPGDSVLDVGPAGGSILQRIQCRRRAMIADPNSATEPLTGIEPVSGMDCVGDGEFDYILLVLPGFGWLTL